MGVRLKVKEVAQQKGISQRQLYLRSGVDINIIRRVYRNPGANITIETLGKLARHHLLAFLFLEGSKTEDQTFLPSLAVTIPARTIKNVIPLNIH